MIEALLRLIPRWVLPAALAVTLWVGFIHFYVADTFYFRMTLPLVKASVEEAKDFASYHGLKMTEADATNYMRCIFDRAYEEPEFRFGFSLYVASATLVGNEALNNHPDAIKAILTSKVCGAAPWMPS